MRLLLLVVALLGLLGVVSRLRKRQVSVWGAVLWCALWVAVGIVAIIPELTNRLADLLGIGRGADVVVYSAIVVLAAIAFRTSVRIEQLERSITTLTREVALREHEREKEHRAK